MIFNIANDVSKAAATPMKSKVDPKTDSRLSVRGFGRFTLSV